MADTVGVTAVARYLPERSVAVADLPELAELSGAEADTCLRLGIDEIRVGDELSAVDLAVGAGNQVLAQAGLSPRDVDALIVIESRSPESLLSSEATRVQALLGARRAVTFSVGGLGCVSITPALLTARGLMAADDEVSTVLVVHGSKPATTKRYRHPVTVNGDGGQAVLLSKAGQIQVLDVMQMTNGDYWDLFTVDYRDRPTAQWREECTDLTGYSFRLAVETRNHLLEMYRRLLDRNGMRPSDVACHISQNLSAGSFQFIGESIGAPIAKSCHDNLRLHGHLGPNDMLFNLSTAIETGELAEGERAVLLNVSPVAAWSLLLVENRGSDTGTPAQ
jgi:3-oxoacyl-[acyl-carrier-protein] synthase-3